MIENKSEIKFFKTKCNLNYTTNEVYEFMITHNTINFINKYLQADLQMNS